MYKIRLQGLYWKMIKRYYPGFSLEAAMFNYLLI
jgi:hypothetical protein